MTIPANQLGNLVTAMPFAASLGIRVTSASRDEVIGTLDWALDRTTTGGLLHGGVLMSFADSVGAVCAFLNLPPGATTSTVSSSTVFVRGVREGTITATARPLHAGRTTIAISTELRTADGKLVAQVTQSQAVLAPAAG
jgi:1,4-dihydroxy-2-naphthoyl-CoA hydrolase